MSVPLSVVLQRAYRCADLAISAALLEQGFDVKPWHSTVLAHIDIEGGTRPSVLAERASVTKQAIAEVVAELEVRGLVRRVPDPADGRAKLVRLTARGKKMIRAAHGVIGEIEAALLTAVGADDLAAAHRTLNALVDLLSGGGRPKGR